MLQYQKTDILSPSKCRQDFQPMSTIEPVLWSDIESSLDDNMLCTGNAKGNGACAGDSGNGLIWNDTLIGVSTASIDCAKGFPDFYTNVFAFINWINDTIAFLPGRTILKMKF